jgi:Putative zinc-finger
MRCEEVRELAPEIALGIADGEARAEALRHLSGCEGCRRALEQLSEVADELLLVAPVQEPSAGFESRVVEAMGLQERQDRRRLPRWLTPRWLAPRLGPALATAVIAVAAMTAVYHDDHQTAQRYRETLAQANGSYFQAAPLKEGSGARAGVAFGYEGSPSWLLLTVDAGHRDAVKRAELVTRDGRTIPLRSLGLDSEGSWGGAIPVSLYDVASVRLLGARHGDVLRASFPEGISESD